MADPSRQPQPGHPRRVLMVGPALSQKGGIAAVERALLGAWCNDRYSVRHVATYDSHHGSRLVKLMKSLPALVRVARVIATWRPHIAHVHFSHGGSIYRKSVVVTLARLFGVRTVLLHAHGSDFSVWYEESGWFRRRWSRSLLRSADRIIVLGHWWRDYYTRFVPAACIEMLANPVVCPLSVPPYGGRPLVVLSLGELGERKGTYDTLRAIPEILRRHPGAEFWFGGDGDVDQVREILENEPWGKRVRLMGWVEGDAKAEAFAKARVFLLPSYNEGLPVAVLEAMAHGVPVVTTPVGSIPDAVIDGQTGFLIGAGDVAAIAERVSLLLGDALRAERIGEQARSRALARYDVHALLPGLFAIYDLADDSAAISPAAAQRS